MQQYNNDDNHRQPYDDYLRLQYHDYYNSSSWLRRRMYVDHVGEWASHLAAKRLCSGMSLLLSWRGELMPNSHESLSNNATTSTAAAGALHRDV